jgi:hypothetical protein
VSIQWTNIEPGESYHDSTVAGPQVLTVINWRPNLGVVFTLRRDMKADAWRVSRFLETGGRSIGLSAWRDFPDHRSAVRAVEDFVQRSPRLGPSERDDWHERIGLGPPAGAG